MIEVDRLTKRYADRTAVENLSFAVAKGDIVGFLGPNGAGKSTTLRMITGFLAPTEGAIRIDGIDALARPLEARKRIGYMPEGVPLYLEMRVAEYLRYRAELKGVGRQAIKAAVDRSLEQAGVADARDRIIGQLSKGYRQRVGLADALVADPPLLILDEPTAGLDPNQIRQVRSLVRGFAGEKTVLVSTHILPEVEATCEHVVIINKGRIVGQGAPGTLRQAEGATQLVSLYVRGGGSLEPKVRAVLEGARGVRSVREIIPVAGEDVLHVRLTTDADPAVTEAIFSAVASGGLVLRELKAENASLEDVFAHLTTTEELDESDDAGSDPPPPDPSDNASAVDEGRAS